MKTVNTAAIWQYKVVEYLLYIAIISIPLVSIRSQLFAYTSLKSFLCMGIISTAFLLHIWGKWSTREPYRFSWIHAALGFFAVALAISAFGGVNPHISWFGTLQQGTGIVYIYGFILWSFLVGSCIRRNDGFLIRFLSLLFSTSVIVALITFINQNAGPLGNSSYTGAYLLLSFCIGIGLVWYFKEWWKRILTIMGLVVIGTCPMFLSHAIWNSTAHALDQIVGEAQGAALGIILACAVMVTLAATRSGKKVMRIIGATCFIALVLGMWYGGKEFMKEGTRIHTYVVEHKTENRFLFWNIAEAGFIHRPVLGWGWGNYDMVFQTYFDPVLFDTGYGVELAISQPHNVLWEYAATTGIVGLLGYIILFCVTWITLYKESGSEDRICRIFGIVLAGSLAGYFLQNMFSFDTPVVYLLYFSIIGIAIGMHKQSFTVLYTSFRITQGIIFAGGIILSIASFIYLSILPWRESLAWAARVAMPQLSDRPSPQRISVVGGAGDTAFIAGKIYEKSQSETRTETEKKFFAAQFSQFIRYLSDEPSDNYKVFLVKGMMENSLAILSKQERIPLLTDAAADLRHSIALNPKTPEPYFSLVQTMALQHTFSDAYAYLRAGITLAPRYEQGYAIGQALLSLSPNKGFAAYEKKIRTP